MKKLLCGVAVIVVISMLSLTLLGCGGKYDATMKEGHLDKATSMTVHEDGTFRVLQFTDTHLISNGANDRDCQTLEWMRQAVEMAKPDLVELTGDITGSGTRGRNNGILAIANMFEEMGQYWAYSFGNHDGEWNKVKGRETWVGKEGKRTNVKDVCSTPRNDPNAVSQMEGDLFYGDNTLGNQEIFDLLHGYKYCLSRQDPWEKDPEFSAEMGVGNYVIELKNSEDKVVYALIHMDTHGKMYFNPKDNKDAKKMADVGYVGLTDKQIEWYGIQAKHYAELGVKSAVFMHIPHFGFRESVEEPAIDKVTGTTYNQYGVPQFKEKEGIRDTITDQLFEYAKNKYGFVKEEGVYSCHWDDNLERAIDQYKTTNLIAVGHDHNNSFAIKKNIANKYNDGENEKDNNIVIAYGRCSGVNAWGRKIAIGATFYDINTNATSIEDMYDLGIIYPDFEYVRHYKDACIQEDEPHYN